MNVVRRIWANPTGRLGLVLVALLLLAAAFAPLLSIADPNAINVRNRFATPSLAHPFGTDHLGRDLLSRLLYGSRIAMLVALSVNLLSLTVGIGLGMLAAYAPRAIDRTILGIFDVLRAFPTLALMLAMVAVFGPSLTNVILIISVTSIPLFGRVARAQTLALQNAPFLEAEVLLGAPHGRLFLVHLLPNIIGPLAVVASMETAVVIAKEAALSFLGLGVRPPLASWGTLLYDGYAYLSQSTWPVLFAALAIIVATLGFSLFGEALRDATDPKLRREP